jgi:cyclopropane fatty-acyl-phospholipid synthase-like methyltransferase
MPITDMDSIYRWEINEGVDTLCKCGLKPGMTVLDFGCGCVL